MCSPHERALFVRGSFFNAFPRNSPCFGKAQQPSAMRSMMLDHFEYSVFPLRAIHNCNESACTFTLVVEVYVIQMRTAIS
jgi:hypothetical protein